MCGMKVFSPTFLIILGPYLIYQSIVDGCKKLKSSLHKQDAEQPETSASREGMFSRRISEGAADPAPGPDFHPKPA